MTERKWIKPPNLHAARCCGTCGHWGFTREGVCDPYPKNRIKAEIYWPDSFAICDDYERDES